jgi:glyceraldehyde-3-phosphate dehydrogenase/erythrose-4-phosphate dehydrogenase
LGYKATTGTLGSQPSSVCHRAAQGGNGRLEDGWASSRIVGDPHSSIIDLPLIELREDTLISVAAWYDNDPGYAARLAEVAAYFIRR